MKPPSAIRVGLVGVALALQFAAPAWTQVQDLPAAAEQYGGFGLPDPSGARLLLLANVTRPELLKVALCTGGRRVPVRFDHEQVARERGTGRDTPWNFDNLAGRVFSVLEGTVDSDATCFLASEPVLTGAAVLTVAAPTGAGACVQRQRIATLRDRPVIHCWPIGRAGTRINIALIQFERRGKDALTSLVVVDGNRAIFADYPAEYRGVGQDLWRVDDAGVLSRDGIEIICVLQRGAWYALGIAWHGSEGTALSLQTSEGTDRFKEVINDYWYQAPIATTARRWSAKGSSC